MFNEVGLEGLSSLSWNISGGLWPVPIHWNYTQWITWCKSNASSSTYIYCPLFCYSINKGALEHLKGHDVHAREIAVLFLVKREMRCSQRQLLCSSRLGRSQEGSSQPLDEVPRWLTSGIHQWDCIYVRELVTAGSHAPSFVEVDLNMVASGMLA